MTSFAEVEPLDQEWCWAGRIPAGDVTLIAGAGGIGKSFLLADLGARIWRGCMTAGRIWSCRAAFRDCGSRSLRWVMCGCW